jgi:hypothetical protein
MKKEEMRADISLASLCAQIILANKPHGEDTAKQGLQE